MKELNCVKSIWLIMTDKILIVGDCHLGRSLRLGKSGVGTNLNTRILDQIVLLDWIVAQLVEHQITILILVGDIFDEAKPDLSLIKIFFEFLQKCQLLHITIHVIVGNHDLKRTGVHQISALDLIEIQDYENVFVHKEITTIWQDEFGITFVPFRDRKSSGVETHDQAIEILKNQLDYEVAEIPLHFTKILVGHLALDGSIFVGDEIDDQANELMCPLTLFSKYDYTWMGHVHKPQLRSAQPHIAHIGSLDLSDYGEANHHKILIMFDCDKKSFIEIPVPTRPLRHLSFSVPVGESTTSWLIKQINLANQSSTLDKAIVKLEVKLEGLESPNANREEIKNLIYQLGAHYLSDFAESRNISVVSTVKSNLTVDNGMKPKMAIRRWAKSQDFKNKDDQDAYLGFALETVDNL